MKLSYIDCWCNLSGQQMIIPYFSDLIRYSGYNVFIVVRTR